MKLTRHRREGGYTTSYRLIIGSREAREAGFLLEDGTSREIVKTVDKEHRRIILQLAEDETERT